MRACEQLHRSNRLLANHREKMATNDCLPGANGQFFHAWSQTRVFCLYTLLLCIALLHATAAPTQYRPLTGNTVLYRVRAAIVHSDTITDMALCGPQNSYADYLKDKLVHNANISYCCPLHTCQLEVCTKLEPADLWLESQQSVIPSKDPRPLHADDCSIARIRLTPLWCDSAGTFLKVPAANESSFRQPIYSGAPVSQEQQFTQYADYGKLTQVIISNKSSLARSRSQPFRSNFNLPIAAGASRQHKQIHRVPHECICSRHPTLAVKP